MLVLCYAMLCYAIILLKWDGKVRRKKKILCKEPKKAKVSQLNEDAIVDLIRGTCLQKE